MAGGPSWKALEIRGRTWLQTLVKEIVAIKAFVPSDKDIVTVVGVVDG
jgi:hypothetical protein